MSYLFVFLWSLVAAFPAAAQDAEPATDSYVRAEVLSIVTEEQTGTEEAPRLLQTAEVRPFDGPDAGESLTIENAVPHNRQDLRLQAGDTVVLQRIEPSDGNVRYLMNETYRLPALLWLTVAFFVLGIVLGGRVGFTSLLGLAASVAIIVFFVVPQIIAGYPPLLISTIGAVVIASTSIYLAHGVNRRTSLALVSTIFTLFCSVGLAVVFVSVAQLFGMGSEESVFLQTGPLQQVQLRGLLLGGIIIGTLGVLDDITTAQTAAVDELSKANHRLGFRQLYTAGRSIGREHIAALINTLALAYVGASLPLLLLLFSSDAAPWWVTLNSSFLAEEVVRTLVGSSTLLLAVPISTWLAAKAFAFGKHTGVEGHVH